MAEFLPPSLGKLNPGDVIKIDDLTELASFEDLVVAEIKPDYDAYLWDARVHLRDLIRPPKFNGTIANIDVTLMADPYERLLDAPSRGFKLPSTNYRIAEYNLEEFAPLYMGFEISADARSTGRGVVGQVQTEAWYYPLTPNIVKAGTRRVQSYTRKSGETVTYEGVVKTDRLSMNTKSVIHAKAIGRVVARPKMETKKFIEHNETSRQIAFEQIRWAIRRPFRGMHE